jgi:two-component system CheB/CheR fusion protein
MEDIDELRVRLHEAEETLRALRDGEVDAVVVNDQRGERVYALRSAEHPYRQMVEGMRQGAVTLASEGTILYCNRCFAEMLRTPPASVVGGSIQQFLRESDRLAFESLLRDGLTRGSQGELVLRAGDGTIVPVYLAFSSLALDDLVAACLVVTDLTEQKRNEQIVADERLARSILEHATEAIVVCDQAGTVLRTSRAAQRLCETSCVGRPFEVAFPLRGQRGRGAFATHLRSCTDGRTTRGVEASLAPRDGDRQLLVSAGPLYSLQHEVLGCVLTLTDITERRQAEIELERARHEAEAANQAKDQFLASLSHELRTPLTPVLAVLSGIGDDHRIPEDVRDRVAMMRRTVELEARLIDDILDLTRIVRGKLELRREITDLRSVLEHALQTCAGEMVAKRQWLIREVPPGDLRLWADTARLTQVFWNLLSNAVKFTPEAGTISVRVRIASTSERRQMAVEVGDSGMGIEAEELEHIFDAFHQGREGVTRRLGGLGLGLAISRAIVELHGGTIAAESGGKGQGARFTVRLPAALELARTGPGERATGDERRGAAEPAADRSLHILLVEDHADTAEAMADLLRAFGNEVTVANSLAEGVAAAEVVRESDARAIDLVVSDLGLPDGSGFDLMRELAGRYGLRGIALSGYGMEEDVRRSREAGFERHLTKPVDLQALRAAILEVAGAPAR